MGELSGRLSVERNALDSKPLKQARHNDASDGVDCIENHLEAGCLHRLCIHSLEGED